MESHLNQDGLPRPSYVFSADPIARPSEINFDGIKLDLSHEFSLVAANPGANHLGSKNYLQVCLRIRPFTQSEKEHETEGCVQVLDSQNVLLKDPQSILGQLNEKGSAQMAQKFSFSRVFGPETSQKEFFLGCIMQPVKDLLKGHSRLIFTYGLTNSGKTYTFQGTEENIGILPRTLNVLFDSLQERLYTKMNFKPHRCRDYLRLSSDQEKEEGANKSALLRQVKEVTIHNDSYDILCGSLTNSLTIPEFEESMNNCDQSSLNVDNIKYSVWVSFFEIYNESIYDLFVPVSSKFQKRKMLRLSQDVKGYSFIKDLQWIQVSDSKEAYRLLKLGVKHQSVAFTKLNNASSRRFQQHVPFRESKLTHYFQSFFNGKGKICMIINISQCCSAYDETLNVLKFSTIAQKVYVPDALSSSQEKSFESIKSSQDVSVDNNLDSKIINVKRTTVSWENSLEDLVENEDLVEDLEKSEETQNTETELTDEDIDKTLKEYRIFKSNQNEVCVKISVLGYFFLKLGFILETFCVCVETLLQERETLEENAERRLAIFKDLVGKCDTQDEPTNTICAMKVGTEEARNYVGVEDIIDSLQDDVTDIKKQAELAHLYITSLADPQEAIACLQLKFNQVKEELSQTKEELVKAQEELKSRKNDSLVQGLKTSSQVDTSLIISKSTCNETVAMPKDSRTQTHPGRKRLNEDGLQQGEPPAKKGLILVSPPVTEDQKKSEEIEQSFSESGVGIRILQEKNKELKRLLIIGENELKSEKVEKAKLNEQVVSLQQQLCFAEEKNLSLRTEVEQIQASYDSTVAELHTQRAVNQEQEERILKLSQKMETATRSITSNVSQIQLMQTKIDQLRSLDSPSRISKIDLLYLQDLSNGPEGDNLLNTSLHLPSNDLSSKGVKDYHIQELSRERSFHSSIEAIWEVCKEIVKASSKKSYQIQELEEQIEKLQVEVKGYRDENNELQAKKSEDKHKVHQLEEKESLIQQLREELQEKCVSLGVQVQLVAEREQTLSELTRDVAWYKAKVKELEMMVETQKDECRHLAELEQGILEKDSAILKLEANLKELEANHQDHIKSTKDLNEKEIKLKEEITQLTNNLHDMKQSLQLKEEERETSRQETGKLKEELAANHVLTQNLQADLQRKEEDYAELKEKLTDAKKQIEQVQKEVSVMRDEEKLLRIKINELEKKKNQYSQEIEMKQRTIQQLKEQLNKHKMEETVQQYERVCKDLSAKEKVIEDMRLTLEEQEQTQVEQDRVLEAKLEEADCLAKELDKWKEKFQDLEARSSERSNKDPVENTDALTKKLSKLQDELQESEEKYQADRKKWLEEKAILTTQAKEAENLRNREMKKYAEDRERCLKLQIEVETLTAQLAEKTGDLQKWREERDQLVTAVEAQMKALLSSSKHKDEEIQQLKRAAAENLGPEKQTTNVKPEHNGSFDLGGVETEPQASFEISRNAAEVGNVSLHPSSKKTYSLRSQAPTVSADMTSKKREGTLQKFGDFLQHSPTILQSKAKKIIETMSSPKFSTAEVSKENVSQPKKGKRKLFRNEISSPINISGQVVSYYLVFISIKLFFNSKVFVTLNFMIIIF
ncbi:Kinesin-like protein KIF20B [Microtus ochrogaster]|uniref:Kinesin-like protein KIF20B n=1 Tax=Microtus ochrogaster TaxID=79684 RepID=A0A8J6L592_MICOH|nr:Kinesin-like protein KIF20B [Microtus ochrogaster]